MAKSAQRVLNPKQELAAAHVGGPMLVRAGAGTGKTTVLVERICRLIVGKHAKPEQILAVTYTEEAAREMGERARRQIESRLGPGSANGLRTATFHACCYEILKRNQADFDVLDKSNLWVYLRRQLDQRRLPLQKYLSAANPAEFLNDFIDFFDRCSDELVNAGRYAEYVASLRSGTRPLPRIARQKEADQLSREEVLSRCDEIASVYVAVEHLLAGKNLGTFGLMIVKAVELLRTRPELLKGEQERTRFLLVDEFQDCNAGQIEFAHLLAGATGNVFAVGDPDQAIYRFRGASSGAFDEFLARFPGAGMISLGENYRSISSILKATFALISANPDMQSGGKTESRKQLESAHASAQPELFSRVPPEIVVSNNFHEEAHDVAESISTIRNDRGAKWQDFAVLYRAHGHRLEIIKELAARGIPFVVVGVDLLNTAILRDVVAVLRGLLPVPDDVSLFRLALMPRFGIDLNDLQRQLSSAKRGSTLTSVLDSMAQGRNMLRSLKELHASAKVDRAPVSAVLAAVIKNFRMDSGREEMTQFARFIDRWEALSITTTKRLSEFIEYLDYFCESGGNLRAEKIENVDGVRLMTLHAAKGLEFDHVYVLRIFSHGGLPSKYRAPLFEFPSELRSATNIAGLDDSKILHQEEERRGLYVGMTRARKTLALHGKAAKGKERVPSLFLRELAKHKQAKLIFTVRDALPFRVDIAAAAATPESAWLGIAPHKDWATQPLSAYAIELYQSCPLKFKLSRDWNLPAEPAAMMQFGSVMHRVLSDYYNSVIAKSPYSESQVLEIFRDQLASSGMEDPLQRELYLSLGASQLQCFLKGCSTQADVLGTERSFSVEIAGATVNGRIDRIDRVNGDAVELIDYKSGRPKTQQDAEKSLQLSIYAIAAKRAWNYNVERVVYHNLKDNSRAEIVSTPSQLAYAEDKIRETAEALRAGNFAAKPGYHCRICGYRQLCPATEEKLYTIAAAVAIQ